MSEHVNPAMVLLASMALFGALYFLNAGSRTASTPKMTGPDDFATKVYEKEKMIYEAMGRGSSLSDMLGKSRGDFIHEREREAELAIKGKTDHHEIVRIQREARLRALEDMERALNGHTEEEMEAAKACLRPARASDWQAFLDARTKPCTHFRDGPFGWDGLYVAKRDVVIPAAFGARSIDVIAPHGVKVERATWRAHCNIYDMDDPDAAFYVPSFNDVHQRGKEDDG